MVKLNDLNMVEIDRASSKGNQLKWRDDFFWYKADNNGYEGLSEFLTSKLLHKSSLKNSEFIDYELEQIKYKSQIFNGCKSLNFLKPGCKIITLQRLFDSMSVDSLGNVLDSLVTTKEKIDYIVNNVVAFTGLKDFGEYLYKLFVIDALFLNEDRHTHNIAVIKNKDNTFDYCPIFDNGACLLSDTKIDYPYSENTIDLIKQVKPKMFDESFMDVINDLETVYGTNITFNYDEKDIDLLIDDIKIYDEKTLQRVKQILKYQRNKLIYFFN